MLKIEAINKRFRSFGELVLKYRWLNIALFLVILGVAIGGLRHVRADVDMDNWFLEEDELLQTKQRFEEIFGSDQYCAVLVEADDVFTPEVLSKIREMGRELMERVPFSDDVISLTDFEYTSGTGEGLEIGDLVPDEIPTKPEELEKIRQMALAKPLMKNRIVSDDSRQTWVMLRMKPIPDDWLDSFDENPEVIVGKTVNEIAGQEKYRSLNPKTSGLPVVNVEKQQFMNREIVRLFGLAILFMLLILGFALRSVRGVVFPLLSATSTMVIVIGLQGHLGVVFDPSTIFMPFFLCLAVSIGYAIHLFNHFNQQFRRTGDRREAVLHAIEETGWPLLFTALTTMVALLSFLFIPLRPIRFIGMTSASLVGVTYVLAVTLLPSLLSFGGNRAPETTGKTSRGGLLEGLMRWLGDHVLSKPFLTLSVFGVVGILLAVGISLFEVSFDVRRTYGLKVPYVKRIYDVGQSKVGSLYSYDAAIEFENPGDVLDPENLRKIDTLVSEIKTFPLTRKVTSIVDIVKDMNQSINAGLEEYHRIPDSREMVAQLLLLYENAGGVEAEKWADYDYQRVRLMVELGDYNSGEAMRELRAIQKRGDEMFPSARVLLVGTVSQFTVMQDYMTWGQVTSFFLAMGAVTMLMALVFGSLKTGVIAMIPNVFPALAVGGIMGYTGIPLDMMTVTIMPMLLGLSVDDTIHFINHSQLEFARTGSYRESIRRVFLSVGSALFLTSLVLILGFSAYLGAMAKVFFNMGILIGVGILTALVVDFFVTPVLLERLRPFGREMLHLSHKGERH
ncbi:RND family transporter [Prosthecochloris sp. N3]|uniref:RND family transporter n=1 Tax=Prosthecochloris ethylica TaxID=2743976 RepID=A0ABR9XQF8_9CHLB|nr:MMPL family transporter [Prosthecochloris ethylica]MBF0587251.1 RND family transporter [Prosthecochloris ethylica]MBF0636055.1 RND family transporter [Prosthecochloris ethylica]NUK48482.1 RND family transporter [Prosthecochloris ethylica]